MADMWRLLKFLGGLVFWVFEDGALFNPSTGSGRTELRLQPLAMLLVSLSTWVALRRARFHFSGWSFSE
jgi:hypothetical protein